MPILRYIGFLFAVLLSGCTTYGVVQNEPLPAEGNPESYSIRENLQTQSGRSGRLGLHLAFSGGGTRAAALAYGVMLELRDTSVVIDGRDQRLLDEVDSISSVSGGSFTAAYYGLYGDRIFDDFEEVFLRRDVEGSLLRGLFNPVQWFSSKGRTEMAVRYYEENVFNRDTFADLRKQGGPLILINASDLGYGVRFSFVQEYFNLLCSDIATFPVARAVTASSAVPVLFKPVVLQNHPDCNKGKRPDWLVAAEERARDSAEFSQLVSRLDSLFDKDRRKYVHMVDGGITDNLGLRALYDWIELSGGAERVTAKMKRKPPRDFAVISVNASTDPHPEMDLTPRDPTLSETVNAVTDVQLHLYNTATIQLMENAIPRWAREVSTPGARVRPHFIQVSFRDVDDPKQRLFFNRVPTSFNLTDDQVDSLIRAGRELLRANPEFQRFVAGLQN
jgi:NTE family protein